VPIALNADSGELFAGVVLAWSAIQVVTGKYEFRECEKDGKKESKKAALTTSRPDAILVTEMPTKRHKNYQMSTILG